MPITPPAREFDSSAWLTLLVVAVMFVGFLTGVPHYAPVVAASLAVAILIAVLMARRARRHAMAAEAGAGDPHTRRSLPLFGPQMAIMMKPIATEHPAGLLVAIGLLLILFAGVPPARLFLMGMVVAGLLVGVVLWLRHR